jgi:7,8-dihydro-6-hydroxymethylpterin dimethyltransferase
LPEPRGSLLRVFNAAPPVSPFHQRQEEIRAALLPLDAAAAVRRFGLEGSARLLKTTVSLCPDCLVPVPALVHARDGRVLMRKTCEEHGESEALLESDERFYHLSNKDRWGRRYATGGVIDFPTFEGAGCCGGGECGPATAEDRSQGFSDQMGNKTCTVLVEVTNACNLACPVCYSDARGDRKLPLEAFQRYLDGLIEKKGGLDSVQLTGGEAALHPEFWEMVAFLHSRPGVKKIYLPTNGILFARPEMAERLVPFRDKMMVLLQFDGQAPETNRALRDANPQRVRDQALSHLGRLGIHMQLTMTITRSVNDAEIGWVIDTGMKHDHVKVIALQPVTYSGRYDLEQDPLERLTLSDVAKAVAAQVRKRAAAEDFVPIPCSHPNCGWITLFVRRFGLVHNITRSVDLDQVMGQVANRTLLSTDELRNVVGTRKAGLLQRVGTGIGRKLIRSTDVFGVAIKPFMDRYNYDQDRISACCHHLLDTQGRPVSFCEYNARLRPGDSWEPFPRLREA